MRSLTMALAKGDRVGIVGPNGAGKTSLLQVLLGKVLPALGEVHIGKNTKFAHLDQSRGDLKDTDTVYDAVVDGQTHIVFGKQTMETRSYLLRFLFNVPMQKKRVGMLSGGERARLALARVLRNAANLVVLDEPTNDLDVATLSALESSLLDSGGSALIVTHDRWFLDRVATHILSFEDDGKMLYLPGNYSDFLELKNTQSSQKKQNAKNSEGILRKKNRKRQRTAPSSDTPVKKLTYAEKIELEQLATKVEEAEAKVSEGEESVANAKFVSLDYKKQAKMLEELGAAKAVLEVLFERWIELSAIKEAEGKKVSATVD